MSFLDPQTIIRTGGYLLVTAIIFAECGLLIGFFLKEGGAAGVALFIGGAMLIMIITIGGFGPRTRHLSLEEIAH